MNTLKKYLQILWQWLKTYKKRWFLCIILIGAIFLIRFPYEEAILYFINQINKQTKYSIQLKYENLYINPLGPTLVFNKPEILTTVSQDTFKAEQLSFRPSYKSLLQLKKGAVMTIKWPNSTLKMSVRKKSLNTRNQEGKKKKLGWFIHINTSNFNPAFLDSFIPALSKTKGNVNIDMQIMIDPEFRQQPEGQWNITGRNVYIQALSYTFPGKLLGGISLPSLQWSKINFQGQIKKSEVAISDLSLGGKTDDFQLKTRGILSIRFNPSVTGQVRPNIKNYRLGVEILANENLKSQFYSLDLLFSKIKSKTPKGWRYLGNIRGNMATLPSISPVSQLPTLKDIQNPPDNELF